MNKKSFNFNGKRELVNLVLSAMFLAMGIVLPFLTGQIQQIGNMLLPMHIPVFLCGLICGWKYGLGVGFILPLFRSLLFTMPPMYPNAIAMAFELAVYGLVSGLIYSKFKRQNILSVYFSMLPAMLAGRGVWAVMEIILLGVSGGSFTFSMFVSGAFVTAVPGIILQLILIPILMSALNFSGVLKYKNELW